MKKILIIEDEETIREGITYNFKSEGYDVQAFESAEDALDTFHEYDLIILDVMLPQMQGTDFLKIVRKSYPQLPILMLTAKSSEEDVTEALKLGADDYVTKPFRITEILLRAKRMLERSEWYRHDDVKILTCSTFSVNFDLLEAYTQKGTIKLTQYEAFILKLLSQNKGKIVSKKELLEKVWGYNGHTETRTIDVFISRLRKHLDTFNKKYIKTVRGVGYIFDDE